MPSRPSCLLRVLLVLVSAALLPGSLMAQRAGSLSLTGGPSLVLGPDWVERRQEDPPAPDQLFASAPRMNFSQSAAAENRVEPGAVRIALSDNPFEGLNSAELEVRMRAPSTGLTQFLFYFFFPPPRSCLLRAQARLEEAQRDADEAARRSAGDSKEKPRRKPVSITHMCDFAPNPLEFFAAQLSPGLALGDERSHGLVRSLYIPSMEEVEHAGKTFYLFEAQDQRYLEQTDLDRFNLPQQALGARVHFFWAVGADTPFPFFRDPLRKRTELIHIAFATLSHTGDARNRFREMVKSVRFQ